MALVDPHDFEGYDTEREAVLFAVLRERTRPGTLSLVPDDDVVRRRLQAADDEISEWLEEAEAEGAAMLARARTEAEAAADAIRAQAQATVATLYDDVRSLHQGIAGLLERADALLPALDVVSRTLEEGRTAALPAAVDDVPPVGWRRRWGRLLRRR